jgi:hypothetical protein
MLPGVEKMAALVGKVQHKRTADEAAIRLTHTL